MNTEYIVMVHLKGNLPGLLLDMCPIKNILEIFS